MHLFCIFPVFFLYFLVGNAIDTHTQKKIVAIQTPLTGYKIACIISSFQNRDEDFNVLYYYSPGRPSFDVGLGGEAERPRGGGVLVLGLESGVRGILGLETKGVSYCGLKRR